MHSQEFREMGHHVVDLLADYLDGVEDRAVFPDVEPAEVDRVFDEPMPLDGEPAAGDLDPLAGLAATYSRSRRQAEVAVELRRGPETRDLVGVPWDPGRLAERRL